MNQWSLIQILTFLALLIYPQIRKHLLYLRRHQAREYRVAGILRGGWQYAIIQALVKRKILSKQFFYHPPLIQPEIIDQYKENLLVIIQHWEDFLLKQVGAHQRAIDRILYPVHIILLHEFGKSVIGLFLLHTEHIGHCHLAAFQFQFPVHQFLIDLHPVVRGQGIIDLHTDTTEFLLITHRSRLGDNHVLMDILLDREEQLVGIYRFDQIICDLISDRLIHDAFLLTFSHHHDRHIRSDLLDMRQRLQPSQARHILIEKNNIKRLFLTAVNSVLPAHHRNDLIPFVLQEQDMRFQQINLVISPKYSIFLRCHMLT